MTILRPLAPLLILAPVAGCSQETKTETGNNTSGAETPAAADAQKTYETPETKPSTPLAEAAAAQKAASEAYNTARDAYGAPRPSR